MATIPSFEFQPTLPARGATLFRALRRAHIVISTHTPRTGSDAPPKHGGTRVPDFNPHSPHGERHRSKRRLCKARHFNPHSPHGERPFAASAGQKSANFNPHSPHGERRVGQPKRTVCRYFNPHSPHGERQHHRRHHWVDWHFNPHSPHGERLDVLESSALTDEFQPTLPARGATGAPKRGKSWMALFQPTLPARGATSFV